MRTMKIWLGVVLVVALAAPAWAQEDHDRELGQRLERLERQVHQLAEHMEHMTPAPQQQHLAPVPPMQRAPGMPEMGGPGRPLTPGAVQQQPALSCHAPHWLKFVLLVVLICNVLLAVWVFSDIRNRGQGSGLFIVLALLIGIPAVVAYALIRIGDRVGPVVPPRV